MSNVNLIMKNDEDDYYYYLIIGGRCLFVGKKNKIKEAILTFHSFQFHDNVN